MKSKHNRTTLSLIRNILLFVMIIIMVIIIITIIYEDTNTEIFYDAPDIKYYSKENSNNSNLELVVSNQSFDNPSVKISCYINGVQIFDEEFEVGDQRARSYYFENIIEGEHVLIVTSEEGHEEEYKLQIGPNKKYLYITYWRTEETEHINILESDDVIVID